MQKEDIVQSKADFSAGWNDETPGGVPEAGWPDELPGEKSLADRLGDGEKHAGVSVFEAAEAIRRRNRQNREALHGDEAGANERQPEGVGHLGPKETDEERAARKKKSDDSLRQALKKRGF